MSEPRKQECLYCGAKHVEWFRTTCPYCGDKRLKEDKTASKGNVFGYPEEDKRKK